MRHIMSGVYQHGVSEMVVYYGAMGLAVLFLLSAGIEVVSVLVKGPSWKSLWTTTGSLMLALICFIVGVSFYT
ncbi:hypothetical protein [Antarcticimicrobium sediminis]|uniref:Uncharacterized protein n=1 Tax=Antarcticimicrobium sediminis TaxID=2546227 RepID=A0A4V2Z6M5_9RHOB|nr:hypothetical protein [Antarcticimicrobium sediminis]TDE33176.1 hypothetical protein E1B25_21530 [Antarcticimicrobium sediminis]